MATTVLYADTTDDVLEASDATTYATAYASADYGGATTTGTIGQYGPAAFYLDEGFFAFDTSSIPDSDVVSSAVLALAGSADGSSQDFTLEVAAYDWGASVTTADWRTPTQLSALTVIATKATSGGWSTGGTYNDFTEVSGGLAAAIDKTGTTRLVVFSDRLRQAIQPSDSETVTVYMAESAYPPRLTVTHASGGASTTVNAGLASAVAAAEFAP